MHQYHPPGSLLDIAAQRYGLTAAQLTPMTGGHATFVYEYVRDGQALILRMTPPDIDLRSMRALLEWLRFLADHDGPTARPVLSPAGQLIEQISYNGLDYLASTFEKASGVLAEAMAPDFWSDELIRLLGTTLARYHRIAQRYEPTAPEFRRPEWHVAANCFHPYEAFSEAETAILEQRAAVLARLNDLPKGRDVYGLAHLDLHFGNFFVDQERGRIVLFDFDDCAYGWYVMDIAMLLFDALVVYDGLDREQFGERFFVQFLRGYHAEQPLDRFWIDRLPDFLKLLEIGVYLMSYRFYDPAHAEDWLGKFMPGRRERILRGEAYTDLNLGKLYDKAVGA